MADTVVSKYCSNCDENVVYDSGQDGFFYCRSCGSQSQEFVDTAGQADELLYSGIYNTSRTLFIPKSEPTTNTQIHNHNQTQTQTRHLEDHLRPFNFDDEASEPLDFGSQWQREGPAPDPDVMVNALRLRYTQGLQVIIQLQCQVLVERFGVSPVICGLSGMLWLRFVAGSRVFGPNWACETVLESEEAPNCCHAGADAAASTADADVKPEGKPSKPLSRRYKAEPRNIYGERLVLIWLKYLKKSIPLYTSLSIAFLSCHIAREAILPTDILEWAREGKIPYVSAFADIEKYIGSPSRECPLSSRVLFRPQVTVDPMSLETHAAVIAENIGLLLPPVNFYAIARRYLSRLSLPIKRILSHACRIYEWSMPPDLWLSTSIPRMPLKKSHISARMPTRVCVMSILILSIRILYNINGLGKWEMSLSNQETKESAPSCEPGKVCNVKDCNPIGDSCEMEMDMKPSWSSLPILDSELESAELLCHLEKSYDKLIDIHDYSKDLPTYLKYCRDVIFAGQRTSYEEDYFIEQLWNVYENQEDVKPSVGSETGCGIGKRLKTKGNVDESTGQQHLRDGPANLCMDKSMGNKKDADFEDHMALDGACSSSARDQDSMSSHTMITPKEQALRRLKSDMEMNGFCYIPPRTTIRTGYVHYMRKEVSGVLKYVADADYYILLRACARLAQIDLRIMHLSVLKLERRLMWIENRIDNTLISFQEPSNQGSDTEMPDN